MRQQPLPYRIALGGTLASFCLLFLFITGVLPMFYPVSYTHLTLPTIA